MLNDGGCDKKTLLFSLPLTTTTPLSLRTLTTTTEQPGERPLKGRRGRPRRRSWQVRRDKQGRDEGGKKLSVTPRPAPQVCALRYADPCLEALCHRGGGRAFVRRKEA